MNADGTFPTPLLPASADQKDHISISLGQHTHHDPDHGAFVVELATQQ